MNIHPLLVHFPIALLTLYSLAEILGISKKISSLRYWKPVKMAFLFPGVVGAFFSLMSGEAIEDLFNNLHALVELHSFFAAAATWIFTILAGAYLVELVSGYLKLEERVKFLVSIQKMVLNKYVAASLALLGLAALFVTGSLGVAIVYGPEIDPFVSAVYHLFF